MCVANRKNADIIISIGSSFKPIQLLKYHKYYVQCVAPSLCRKRRWCCILIRGRNGCCWRRVKLHVAVNVRRPSNSRCAQFSGTSLVLAIRFEHCASPHFHPHRMHAAVAVATFRVYSAQAHKFHVRLATSWAQLNHRKWYDASHIRENGKRCIWANLVVFRLFFRQHLWCGCKRWHYVSEAKANHYSMASWMLHLVHVSSTLCLIRFSCCGWCAVHCANACPVYGSVPFAHLFDGYKTTQKAISHREWDQLFLNLIIVHLVRLARHRCVLFAGI